MQDSNHWPCDTSGALVLEAFEPLKVIFLNFQAQSAFIHNLWIISQVLTFLYIDAATSPGSHVRFQLGPCFHQMLEHEHFHVLEQDNCDQLHQIQFVI